MEPVLIIAGSARQGGNTESAVEHLRRALDLGGEAVIHLRACRIEPFSYERRPLDDFPAIVERILAHRRIVFAGPVYWYAMSGLMKTFFDRLTDLLLDVDGRVLARSLAGRDVWLLATGTDPEIPDGFAEPFVRTAGYFGMRWREAFYLRVDEGSAPDEQDFAAVDAVAAALAA